MSAETESLDRYFTQSQNLLVVAGFDGMLHRWNPVAEQILGYSTEEARGKSLLEFVHPEDCAATIAEMQKMISGQTSRSFEIRVRCKDGGFRWIAWNGVPFLDSQELYSTGYDVTDRRLAQEALAEREQQIRILLDSVAEGIYGIDLNATCTFANAACGRILGYERPEDLLGKNMHALVHHSRADRSPLAPEECQILRSVREGWPAHAWDEVFWRRDGTSFPAEYWSYPLRRGEQVSGSVVSFVDITQRRQAAEQRDRFFEHATTPMCVLGFDGYVKHTNPAVATAFGYTREELQAQPFLSFVHPDDRERSRLELPGPGESQFHVFEIRLRCKDGSYKWTAWDAVIDVDRQEFYCIGHDVTDRHLAEEALGEQAALSELTADVGLALTREPTMRGMLQQCAEALVRHVGAAFARIWTLNVAEQMLELQASAGMYTHINGKHARIPVGAFKIGRIARDREPHLTNAVIGDERVHEQEWAKREGMVAFAGYPLVVEDRVVGVAALFARHPLSDTTLASLAAVSDGIALGIQRRRAEEDQRKFVSLVENSSEFIAMADFQGKLLYVNEAGARLTGLEKRDGAWQATFRDVHPDDWLRKLQDEVIPSVLEKGQYVGECQLMNAKTKTRIDVLANLFTVPTSETPEGACFAAVMRDITERKCAERELHDTKEAAEAANRAKSEFLANMSHEIRTPMNGVIGFTELVLDTALTPEQRQYLDGVKISAETLLKIINDILDFSKIEAGRLELDKLDFELRETLGNTVGTLALRAHEKGLELLYEVRPEVPDALIGDPARLWQVVINLVGNSIKFTDHGEISLVVETEEATQQSTLLRFTISDTGIGIPADKQTQLFRPFTQADSSMTRKYGGTGLGLAISQRLVEAMGGRVWFESQPGRGSQFHFTARFAIQKQPIVRRPLIPPARLEGLRVLVVDDNATNRRILRAMLTHWRMMPAEVEGGIPALAALHVAAQAQAPFQLILLDVMMPDMDGFAVLKEIHKEPEIDRPAILMLSSADRPGDIALARELGAAAYLIKPVRPSELLDTIMGALKLPLEQPTPQRAGAPPRAPAPAEGKLRVLVVEDNPINQLLAVRILDKAGYTVSTAGNGVEALEQLHTTPVDVVLMDVQMPVMDGFEATQRIREQERTTGQHVAIIAMTAHALKGDREKCLSAGMDGYVSKPIQTEALFAAIASATRAAERPAVPALTAGPAGRVAPASVEAALVQRERSLAAGPQTVAPPRRHDGDLRRKLAALLLSEWPRRLGQIQQALAARDGAALVRAAHALRASAGALKDQAAVAAITRMEQVGRDGDWARAGEVLQRMTNAVSQLVSEFSETVGTNGGLQPATPREAAAPSAPVLPSPK